MFAYNLRNFQISGDAPLGLDGNIRWDIVAKADGDAPLSRDDFRAMLLTLLRDRFHLAVHTDSREMSVYALIVAKGGPKLKPSLLGTEPMLRTGPRNGSRNYTFTGAKAAMSDLIGMILGTAFLDRPLQRGQQLSCRARRDRQRLGPVPGCNAGGFIGRHASHYAGRHRRHS
jgi:uncharacterized protein (TIGR03435 family)